MDCKCHRWSIMAFERPLGSSVGSCSGGGTTSERNTRTIALEEAINAHLDCINQVLFSFLFYFISLYSFCYMFMYCRAWKLVAPTYPTVMRWNLCAKPSRSLLG